MTAPRRRVVTRIATLAMVLAASLGRPAEISGQVLDLDPTPTFPTPEVSVLEEIAAAVVGSLPPMDLDTDAGIVEAAGSTLRRVVSELATRGRGDSPGDAIAGLVAIRLADTVDSIEKRLARLAIPGAFTGSPPRRLETEDRRRALDRLRTFARSGLETLRRLDTDDVAGCDDALAIVMAPIADALEILERRPLADRWPTVDEVDHRGGSMDGPELPPLPTDRRIEALDRRLRDASDSMGRRRHRSFREAVATIDRLAPESEVGSVAREALLGLVVEGDDRTRGLAIERLVATAEAASALEALDSTTARRDVDVDTLRRLFRATVEGPLDRRSIDALARQASLCRLVSAGGAMDLATVSRDLRPAARAIQSRHRRIVRSTASTLARLGADPVAMSDPELVGGLQALEGSIADLARLETADDLVVGLTSIRPGASREFRRRIRTWCLMLGSDAERMNGKSALDRIATDLRAFAPLPAEAWLESGTPGVADRTGGRAKDLLDRSREVRRAWADEISHGEVDGEARTSLSRLARLGALLESLDAILGPGGDAIAGGLATCGRWGGWHVAPERFGWTARNLLPTLRIACIAAADGEADRLERDLDRMEKISPPASVVVWLSEAVGPLVGTLSGGSLAAVASVATPPGLDAWGAEDRVALAGICRAFAEIAAAERRGDEEGVRRMSAWVVAASDDLLDDVRARSAIGPTTE